MCFADDLMIFCGGEAYSASLVKDCLVKFKELSWLTPNPVKSNIFMCGLACGIKDQIINLLGYNEGKLPVRYLGVPLISYFEISSFVKLFT